MLLSMHACLNPAVASAAELFTDGALTDAVLQGIASMHSLHLYIEPGATPTSAERAAAAERALIGAMSARRVEVALYAAARRRLGMANQRPAADRRAAQAAAMGALNRTRATLRKTERRLATAQAALASLGV
ncbi:hypothetical protein D9599_25865 [Roseomonas sp. KE2513]|uniref:hypothetical protein n=1 Tax=Roseomonas sp. KE2513 TaxID=2479202 RepID=UPI0018DF0A61|nr:hypothetical protein [Roseomonas sp. KE2513]MBI0538983.1 hypothetical protein [Roseomonas sp. KE2513]